MLALQDGGESVGASSRGAENMLAPDIAVEDQSSELDNGVGSESGRAFPIGIDRLVGPGTLSSALSGSHDYIKDGKNISEELMAWRRNQIEDQLFLQDYVVKEILSLNFIFNHMLVKDLQTEQCARWRRDTTDADESFIMQVAKASIHKDRSAADMEMCSLAQRYELSDPSLFEIVEVRSLSLPHEAFYLPTLLGAFDLLLSRYQLAAMIAVAPSLLAAKSIVTGTIASLAHARKRGGLTKGWIRGTYNVESVSVASDLSIRQEARLLRQDKVVQKGH
ncbi:hypothetical protein DFQ26_001884 [Actinomortierella ambigua]|nr:hypothetical protein DFQ26_001884 [Actinomortierella ambigua]